MNITCMIIGAWGKRNNRRDTPCFHSKIWKNENSDTILTFYQICYIWTSTIAVAWNLSIRLREFWAPAFEREKTERPNIERPTFERRLLSDHLGARLLSAHYSNNNRSKVGAYLSGCACVLRLTHMNICIHARIFTKIQSRRNLIFFISF